MRVCVAPGRTSGRVVRVYVEAGQRPAEGRVRLYGLAGAVVGAVVLPFAVASAESPGDGAQGVPPAVRALSQGGGDDKAPDGAGRAQAQAQAPGAPARSPLPPAPATAVRCGPELTY
ncbi:hypothetical protein [Streptomyces sp. NPDC057363]|uniref:hypothetical protein n=1 Tax=Streptomyces sp. NPDC057363 TaxID=3346107 RepID=UPI00363A5C68